MQKCSCMRLSYDGLWRRARRPAFTDAGHWAARVERFRRDHGRLAAREGGALVLLGDSITEAFPRLLLRAVDPRCVNRGIACDHLEGDARGMLRRLDVGVCLWRRER